MLRSVSSSRDGPDLRSEEHTSELQSQSNLVCRLLLEKKKNHETNCAVPSSMVTRVLYSSRRRAFERSAKVTGTSPSWSGNHRICAYFPSVCSISCIKV